MPSGGILDLLGGIRDGHPIRHGFDHRKIVLRIAEADHLIVSDMEGIGQGMHRRPLVPASRRDIDQRGIHVREDEAKLGHLTTEPVPDPAAALVASADMDIRLHVVAIRIEVFCHISRSFAEEHLILPHLLRLMGIEDCVAIPRRLIDCKGCPSFIVEDILDLAERRIGKLLHEGNLPIYADDLPIGEGTRPEAGLIACEHPSHSGRDTP